LLDNPQGPPSHGVVDRLMSALHWKKIVHAGTLDPLATGLLPILLGEGTKIARFLLGLDKVYLATMRLGEQTDTDDAEGRVVATAAVEVGHSEIEGVLSGFVGRQLQQPPVFSALKIEGRPAYVSARRGEAVHVRPREIEIYGVETLSVTEREVTFRLACSSGTYVRAVARDAGERLGCHAHLTRLRRLSVGPYKVEDALTLERVQSNPEEAEGRLIGLNQALAHLPEIAVDAAKARRVRLGVPAAAEIEPPGDVSGVLRLTTGGELVAVLEAAGVGSAQRLCTLRVFASQA
ncbi:MAG: tRNA pseudouridine(55) synthase TruB, partial [Pseudomonadota bacterium]